jgi:dihydrodipicolinate synthase/N-acetylneuraminate lyase
MISKDVLQGPWAGLPVAWKEDLAYDEETYRSDVVRTCAADVPGVYTAGTSGEFYAMEFDEWKTIARVTVEECRRAGTPVMIGVTSTYTLGAARRAAFAAELGADAIQVALPYWMEMDDRMILPFFKEVTGACPGMALSIYETRRAKKMLTLEQHRAVFDSTGSYLSVKSNEGTLGCSPEGCEKLSEFVNVWVGEGKFNALGPYGAVGSASALVYMNPRVILHMFDLLCRKQWDELQPLTDQVERLIEEGLRPFAARGFTDTGFDHLMGKASGFLKMNVRSRGTYASATDEDVFALQKWMQENTPELLKL